MTASVGTLADFLLARIAEDEATSPTGRRPSPRDLAECEAKRRIVEACVDGLTEGESMPYGGAEWLAERTLGLLALPYANHPDHREEWRP